MRAWRATFERSKHRGSSATCVRAVCLCLSACSAYCLLLTFFFFSGFDDGQRAVSRAGGAFQSVQHWPQADGSLGGRGDLHRAVSRLQFFLSVSMSTSVSHSTLTSLGRT